MIYVVYTMVAVAVLMFGGIFIGFIYAAVYDWNYRRKYGVWLELQKDRTKPRRPAAK